MSNARSVSNSRIPFGNISPGIYQAHIGITTGNPQIPFDDFYWNCKHQSRQSRMSAAMTMSMSRYQVVVRAEKLKKSGAFRSGKYYAVLTISGGPKTGEEIGRTEVINDCPNPSWTTVMFVESNESMFVPFCVEIYDKHEVRADRKIAEADFEVTEVLSSKANEQYEEKRDGCKIYVQVTPSVQGQARGSVILQFRALNVENIEAGAFGLGKSDPFIEIHRKNADLDAGIVNWNAIYRSEYILDNLNPLWNNFEISLEVLCHCDLDWPLKLKLLDWQKNGKHRVLGVCETSVRHLQENVSTGGNADRTNALTLTKEGKTKKTGLIIVLQVDFEPE